MLKLRIVWRYQWLKEKLQKDKKQSTKLAKSCGLDNNDDDAEDDARRRLVFPILVCGLWYTRHKLYTYGNLSRFCGFSFGLPWSWW